MLRVSFVAVELRPGRRRITGSPLGCQRPLRLLSPPPSPERSIGGRGQPPTVICFRKITEPFHRSGSPLTCSSPPAPMNYTPVIPSQKDLPQKYGAEQWRSEPQRSRQFSSKSTGEGGSSGPASQPAAPGTEEINIHHKKLQPIYLQESLY